MHRRLADLEKQRNELTATIEAGDRSQRQRPLLHPEMSKVYQDWVMNARRGLEDANVRAEAMNALRAMVQEITVSPGSGAPAIVVKGDLAEMLVAAGRKTDSEDLRQQVMLVAGARNRRNLLDWWAVA